LRSAVLLHDMEGLSQEEVAAAVGCPVGTVKSRLFNARALLRRKLAHYVESEP
jgi:RNA polymerase sigma-70 factor (ECF subfamily)